MLLKRCEMLLGDMRVRIDEDRIANVLEANVPCLHAT